MADANSISKESAFLYIATQAMTLKGLADAMREYGQSNGVGIALSEAVDQIASNIGIIADKQLVLLGVSPSWGEAEDWLIPSDLRQTEQPT